MHYQKEMGKSKKFTLPRAVRAKPKEESDIYIFILLTVCSVSVIKCSFWQDSLSMFLCRVCFNWQGLRLSVDQLLCLRFIAWLRTSWVNQHVNLKEAGVFYLFDSVHVDIGIVYKIQMQMKVNTCSYFKSQSVS